MNTYLNTAFFGYNKHETDEYICGLKEQISELKQTNESLCAEIRKLEFKNDKLSDELQVKTEILKVRNKSFAG